MYIQEILQAIADEISANNNAWGKQKVPLFSEAERYDSNYKPKELKEMLEDVDFEERILLVDMKENKCFLLDKKVDIKYKKISITIKN